MEASDGNLAHWWWSGELLPYVHTNTHNRLQNR